MSNQFNKLCQQAEARLLAEYPNIHNFSTDEFEALVHELQVHQIELELQNDELRRTRIALETSHQQYADFFNYAPIAYLILNSDKQIIQVNEAAVEMLGVSHENLVNSFFFRKIFEPDQERFLLLFNRLVAIGETQSFEIQLIKADDSLLDVRLECSKNKYSNTPQYYVALIDISHRKKVEQQAIKLAVEKENVRILSEFLANAAHDVKTPLTTILTGLHLLSKMEIGEKPKARINKIQLQSAQLASVIEKMFQMSALDSDHEFHLETVNVLPLVQYVVQSFMVIAESKHQSLTLSHDVDEIFVRMDPFLIRRVLSNLLENATTYSPEGCTVLIDVSVQDTELVIAVKDQGVGIDVDDLSRIFERFYRTDRARSSYTGGSGLGLAISKKIIDAHQGGRIEVESEVNKGSTFKVILPLFVSQY